MKRLIATILACGVLGAAVPARAETQDQTQVLVTTIFTELERATLQDYGHTEEAVQLSRKSAHYRGPDHVPPGHMPGPGQCRAWVFGEPPGHQAPAGDCATIAANMPANAELIYGGAAPGARLPDNFGVSLPEDVIIYLPRRDATERVVMDNDIILIDRSTRLILDILHNVIVQN